MRSMLSPVITTFIPPPSAPTRLAQRDADVIHRKLSGAGEVRAHLVQSTATVEAFAFGLDDDHGDARMPSSGWVLHATRKASASAAFPMKVLAPLITHSFPSRTGRSAYSRRRRCRCPVP